MGPLCGHGSLGWWLEHQMHRYFLYFSGDPKKPDEDGTRLQSFAAARTLGIMRTDQLMHDDPIALMGGKELDLERTDERGLVLFALNVCVTNASAGTPLAPTEWA